MLKQPTAHPLIFRVTSDVAAPDHLWPHLDALQMAFRQHNDEAAHALEFLALSGPRFHTVPGLTCLTRHPRNQP